MRKSQHAIKRSKQRGIPDSVIDEILEYGTPVKRPGSAIEYQLRKRDFDHAVKHHKTMIQMIEKARNTAVLLSADSQIITVYHRY